MGKAKVNTFLVYVWGHDLRQKYVDMHTTQVNNIKITKMDVSISISFFISFSFLSWTYLVYGLWILNTHLYFYFAPLLKSDLYCIHIDCIIRIIRIKRNSVQ